MTLPNFLVIGAAKAGTTSLYHYLKQHPDIYMSPDKEPRFFAFEGDDSGLYPYTKLSEYEKLFSNVSTETAVGEASTIYLCNKESPQRIKDRLPNAKLVAVLRNPIERIYSNYIYWRREGKELEEDFGNVVDRDLGEYLTGEGNDMYLTRGLYGSQLQRYFKLFPDEQIRVYLYEELRDSPLQMLEDLYSFLGVGTEYKPDLTQSYNVTTLPDSRIKQYFYTRLMQAQRTRRMLLKILPSRFYWGVLLPFVRSVAASMRGKGRRTEMAEMDKEIRMKLVEFYRSDIELTGRLIGRDLSGWLVC